MTFADLKDDGDFKLITADYKTKQLKVFMGTNVLYTDSLQKMPTAITTFYDSSKKPMLPIIAVACESSIYYWKDFSPLARFDLPAVTFTDEENEIWKKLAQQDVGDEEGLHKETEKLYAIREKGTLVSAMTSELIAMEDLKMQRSYIQQKKNLTL